MSRIAYVNGRYVPQAEGRISIDDRGFQFADGVYEVIEVRDRALIDEEAHLKRLSRSLGELSMTEAIDGSALRLVIREVVRRNKVRDGMVYLQMTRGVSQREHVFPVRPVRPGLVVTARSIDPRASDVKATTGIRVITLPDLRWKRPDIKSTSLLPNVLAKQAAKDRGASEAWLIGTDNRITEGAASNAWIILEDDVVVTHPIDRAILEGVTRGTLLRLLRDLRLRVEERPFSIDEAYGAREAFVTGATSVVMPVVAIDDRSIGTGRPGPIVFSLRRDFHAAAQRT